MKHDSMLRRLAPEPNSSLTAAPDSITLYWHDQAINAQPDDTVASALLMAGIRFTRTSPVSGTPRLPFCMMGSCFECQVEVDCQLIQACMTPVAEGMRASLPKDLNEKTPELNSNTTPLAKSENT